MKEKIIIQEISFEKARKRIRENQEKTIVFSSDDNELNRKILEKESIKILLINEKDRKDFQKQRNSGFNHILAKIAKKKNILIGINFDEILESTNKQKAQIIARVKQNIMLCNKNKIQMKFISQKEKTKRNIYDLKSLGLVLGMPTWMTSLLKNDKNN